MSILKKEILDLKEYYISDLSKLKKNIRYQ